MSRLLSDIIDTLLPPKCIFCRKTLRRGERDYCAECERSLPYRGRGREPGPDFVEAVCAPFDYDGKVRTALMNYKFHGARGCAEAFGRFVAVKSKGKWGLLEMDDKLGYALSMNKGNPVAFRHQKFETTVRLDLPAEVKADNCSFDIPADKGCAIDKTSIQTRNTVNGNFVQYNCVLTIPDSLPDHIVDVKYPVSVVCDGITYPDGELLVKAWHYKYVNMDLSRNETKFVGNDVEFIINMTAEKVAGENDYPLMVEVLQDSTAARVSLEKLSETRYKCRLYSPMIGVNRVVVKVSEAGCPPSLFPFEINYTKPKASSNAGQVEITAKGKDGSTQSSGAAQPAMAAPADSTAVTPADSAAVAPVAAPAQQQAPAAAADSTAKAG